MWQAAGAAGECPVARFPCNVTLTVYPNQHILLTQADVIKLRREDLVAIWKVCHGILPALCLTSNLPSARVDQQKGSVQRQVRSGRKHLCNCCSEVDPS